MARISPFGSKPTYPAIKDRKISKVKSQTASSSVESGSSDEFCVVQKKKKNGPSYIGKDTDKLRKQRVMAQAGRDRRKEAQTRLEETAKNLGIDPVTFNPKNFQKDSFAHIEDTHERRRARNRVSAQQSRNNKKEYLTNLEKAIQEKQDIQKKQDGVIANPFAIERQDSGSLQAAIKEFLWEPDPRTMDELLAEFDTTVKQTL